MIPLNVHNIIDYVIGATLIASPYLFGFSEVDVARNLHGVLGFGLIAYSSITDYRYSVLKIVPLGVHMSMDVAAGVILMLAPYLFGYRDAVSGGQLFVHLLEGLGACLLVAFTHPRSGAERRRLGSDLDTEVHTDESFRKAA